MVRSSGKVKVGSLILLSINLLSVADSSFGAIQPPASLAAVATSSNIAPSGSPLSPLKVSPGSALPDTTDSNSPQEQASITRSTSELHQYPLSSLGNDSGEKESLVATAETSNNEIAHQHGESDSVTGINGVGEKSKVINGEKASSFIDFPPFSKPIASQIRYQRQRRSYPIPSSLTQDFPPSSNGPSFRFTRPDELELRLDDDRDREAFLKLMSLVAADEAAHDENEEDGDDATGVGLGGDDSIDLGTFQRPVANPYWTLGRPSEPINLMSSLLAADPPRPGPHGLYGIGERPLEIGIPRAALQDGDGDDEWMEDPVPLRGSHFKTRRSGNSEFTYNPVKSHFRRYMRATPLKSGRGLEFMSNGGRFGPVMNRRRRATAMTGIPAIHWM